MKNDIRSLVSQDGDTIYECVFGGISFALVHDLYWDMVHFAVKDPAQRSTLANRLRKLILRSTKASQ